MSDHRFDTAYIYSLYFTQQLPVTAPPLFHFHDALDSAVPANLGRRPNWGRSWCEAHSGSLSGEKDDRHGTPACPTSGHPSAVSGRQQSRPSMVSIRQHGRSSAVGGRQPTSLVLPETDMMVKCKLYFMVAIVRVRCHSYLSPYNDCSAHFTLQMS